MHDDIKHDPMVFKPHLVLHAGQTMTTSMAVAKHFGKLHKNVLRAIDNIACSAEFTRLNFEPVDFIDKNGDARRMFRMTRDGFVFLTMGFTGKAAAAWKEAYIGAFNRMEQALLARLREEAVLAEQTFIEERGQLVGMIETLIERVDELNDQVRMLCQDRRALASDLDFIKSRITGPEELGVMMVLCDMRAPDAQLLAYLIRKVCEHDLYRPISLMASADQFARAIGWESVQQVRDALKRLEAKGLISIHQEKRGNAARYKVQSKTIAAMLEAHHEGTHGRASAFALVPDAESPVAALIRKVVGVPQGEHDHETEERISERNLLPNLWKSTKLH